MPGARHDLFAAPLKVTIKLTVFEKESRRRRAKVGPGHQGAGGLLRRDTADDRPGHFHRQRNGTRHRVPAAPLARSLLRVGSTAGPTSSARSSPTAEAGSNSSTTTRTCCMSASTGSGSSWARSSCARWGSEMTIREILRQVLHRRQDPASASRAALRGGKFPRACSARGWPAEVARWRAGPIGTQGTQGQSPAPAPAVQGSRESIALAVLSRKTSRRRSSPTTWSTRESGEVIGKGCEANCARGSRKARWKGDHRGWHPRSSDVIFPETDECGVVLSETLRKDSVKTQRRSAASRFTGSCGQATRPPARPLGNSSRACSSTAASTTFRGSGA